MGLCPNCRNEAESRIITYDEKTKKICDRCGSTYYD